MYIYGRTKLARMNSLQSSSTTSNSIMFTDFASPTSRSSRRLWSKKRKRSRRSWRTSWSRMTSLAWLCWSWAILPTMWETICARGCRWEARGPLLSRFSRYKISVDYVKITKSRKLIWIFRPTVEGFIFVGNHMALSNRFLRYKINDDYGEIKSCKLNQFTEKNRSYFRNE